MYNNIAHFDKSTKSAHKKIEANTSSLLEQKTSNDKRHKEVVESVANNKKQSYLNKKELINSWKEYENSNNESHKEISNNIKETKKEFFENIEKVENDIREKLSNNKTQLQKESKEL